MATKSMLKTVTIKTKNMGSSLADALEKSVKKDDRDVEYRRKCSNVEKESVNKFFDNY